MAPEIPAAAGIWLPAHRLLRAARTPLAQVGTDVNLPVTIGNPDGSAETATQTLRYGYESWAVDCTSDWTPDTSYGRFCVIGTAAPFYSGFASTAGDFCAGSVDAYDATACSADLMFTIAVR